MNITLNIASAQYIADLQGETTMIKVVTDDDTLWVPNDCPSNRHYKEIMRQVDAGELTIADAD